MLLAPQFVNIKTIFPISPFDSCLKLQWLFVASNKTKFPSHCYLAISLIWTGVTGVRFCYLERLCTVEFVDEVKERVRLPQKQHVAAQAVSFHCNREQTAAVVREEKPASTGETGALTLLDWMVERKDDDDEAMRGLMNHKTRGKKTVWTKSGGGEKKERRSNIKLHILI